MDETIAKWIIEYFLHHRIDDKIINGVILSLPLAIDDYRLKKTMLLRRIETETSNGCVSEKILELIEIIEALDHEQGKTASDLMKEAYCLVAVDCTVRFLGENVEENGKYMEMVEIVWKNRVCKSEGLVSEMSKRWLDDIEVAGKDSAVCEKIWMRNTRNVALKAVKAYLKEAWGCLGPPFLEVLAEKEGNKVEGFCGGGSGGGGGGGDGVVCSSEPSRDLVAVDDTQKGQAVIRRKHTAVKSRRQRGAKLSDADEEAVNKAADNTTETLRAEDLTPEIDRQSVPKEAISPSSTKLPAVVDHVSDNVQTAQTSSSTEPTGINYAAEAGQKGSKELENGNAVRMQREFRSRTRELLAAVTNPLPEARKTAQTLRSSMKTTNLKTASKNQTRQDMPTIAEAEGMQTVQEREEKTTSNTKNDAEASKQTGTEVDAPKGSNENDSRNVKESTLNEDTQKNVAQDPVTHNNVRKRSLMEPNDTSHTYQWDDEIENSEGSPVRPRLPSRKVQKTSPLKVPEYRNLSRRRERKRWTSLEEDTLREGVLKYGRGNWKFILLDAKFAEVFQGRTEVDLKDKWRNLTKYSS
ncbi:hypothetical protein RND81_04G231300 [Saponaria officinalis]|uniref:MYB transcription factor n=1 Tax=Saponaria officinalis TaxID=3572 RepID=A0AAW1LP12_SAPOF